MVPKEKHPSNSDRKKKEKLAEKFDSTHNRKYSETNEVFMCIRITKELKQVYEGEMSIDLSQKITYATFVLILAKLGYLNLEQQSAEALGKLAACPLL